MTPTKRGYKVWCLYAMVTCATSKCIPVHLEAMLGRKVMVKRLLEPFKGKGHFVFYDNFFTSVDLAKDLLSSNTYACGTARSNRRKFPESLKKSSMKRGESKSGFYCTMLCMARQKVCLFHQHYF